MKLGYVALQLRLAETRFENRIGGSAALALAQDSTLTDEMMFVIPLAENASSNEYDNMINQIVTERFGVIVALKMDEDITDKTGIKAFDKLHDVRTEIFKALLGWQMPDAESICSYSGGQLLDFNRAWLWYQFEFTVGTRIQAEVELDWTDTGVLQKIYAQYVLGEYDDGSILEGVPPLLTANETNPISGLRLVDMAQMIQRED